MASALLLTSSLSSNHPDDSSSVASPHSPEPDGPGREGVYDEPRFASPGPAPGKWNRESSNGEHPMKRIVLTLLLLASLDGYVGAQTGPVPLRVRLSRVFLRQEPGDDRAADHPAQPAEEYPRRD